MEVPLRASRYGGQPSHAGVSSLACQPKLAHKSGERRLAEREGFEPPVPFRVQRFSRPPPSTTRPPLPHEAILTIQALAAARHLTTGAVNYDVVTAAGPGLDQRAAPARMPTPRLGRAEPVRTEAGGILSSRS
jgi:hypothetical protein